MSFYKKVNLGNGRELSIVVRDKTCNRLKTTCFRGQYVKPPSQNLWVWKSEQSAGNFIHWDSPEGPLSHMGDDAWNAFLTSIEQMLVKEEYGTHSMCLCLPRPVGWESTAPLQNYRSEDLEPFKPNCKSTALRVKPSLVHILAPKTNNFTLVMELKPEEGGAAAVIHSIYPGRDIGPLEGDVTEHEGRVFFDWSHPGE